MTTKTNRENKNAHKLSPILITTLLLFPTCYVLGTAGARRVLALITLLPALLGPHRTVAQEFPLIDQFVGTWEGQGELFGADATFSMQWEWVLENQFVHLTFENSVQTPNGLTQSFNARAFYKPGEPGQLGGTWFDSRGMVVPLQGNVDDNTLTVPWGTPGTEQGRTVYRQLDEGELEVEDYVLRGSEWQKFGHALYQRMDVP